MVDRRVRRFVESELRNSHPGQRKPVSQGDDVVGDLSEVLGNYGKLSQIVAQSPEKLLGGAWAPLPVHRGWLIGRDLPVAGYPPEMVDAEHVEQSESVTHPGSPPGEVPRCHLLPVEDRVAPTLSRLREVVGGNSCHDGGSSLVV